MTRLEELDEIYLRDSVVEVIVNQGDPAEFVEEVKRMVKGNGYDVTKVLREGKYYHIHYK